MIVLSDASCLLHQKKREQSKHGKNRKFSCSENATIFVLLLMMCVGAFIFLSIESEQNKRAEELIGSMIAYRANLTAQLWEITMTVNTFERDKYLNQ